MRFDPNGVADRKGFRMYILLISLRSALVEPIGHFQHQRAIFHPSGIGEIVIGIDQEEIGNRQVAPLKPGIDVQIIGLVVVLHVGGKEQFVGKGNIQFGTNQPKPGVLPRLWQCEMVVTVNHGDVAVGLKFVNEIARYIPPFCVKVAAISGLKIVFQRFSVV